MKLLTGNSNKVLSKNIAKYLRSKLVNSSIRKFADGEIYVEINENIRGNSIFIIQSVSSPANDNLMELLLCIDALKRSSAKNITAVIPYFGYARQDRRVRSARVPISARVVANILESVGVSRVITMDIHSEQIQGYFSIPVDNIYASNIMCQRIANEFNPNELQVVSPDTGGVIRARSVAKTLKVQDLAIIDKRRERANESEVINVIGEVENKVCIVPDDLIDTAGTICNGANALKNKGAKKIIAFITHAVLSGDAIENINNSEIDSLILSNTIDIDDKLKKCPKIDVFDISPVLSESIKRIDSGKSISELYLK